MTLAEMLLRIGCGLVAWMVVYTHCVWLATLRVVGCGPDGDQLWRLLLGFAPITLLFSLLLPVTRKLAEVHALIRWLAVPLVLFVPLALIPLWTTGQSILVSNKAICASGTPPIWQLWWVPVQVLILMVVVAGAYRAWRPNVKVPFK